MHWRLARSIRCCEAIEALVEATDFRIADISAGSSVPFRSRQSERARAFAGSFALAAEERACLRPSADTARQ